MDGEHNVAGSGSAPLLRNGKIRTALGSLPLPATSIPQVSRFLPGFAEDARKYPLGDGCFR